MPSREHCYRTKCPRALYLVHFMVNLILCLIKFQCNLKLTYNLLYSNPEKKISCDFHKSIVNANDLNILSFF